MAKYFDPTRFPFADEPLIIQLEDDLHGIDALKFVADTKNSAVEQGRDQARAMTEPEEVNSGEWAPAPPASFSHGTEKPHSVFRQFLE